MCSFTCFSLFLLNFANMASAAEMTITTRTAPKFYTKTRALQLPIFFLELISLVTTGITEPGPECRCKLSCKIIRLGHGKTIYFQGRSKKEFFGRGAF